MTTPQPAAHVLFLRECDHLTADAREHANGDLRCDLCGAKVTPRICVGPMTTKETKAK